MLPSSPQRQSATDFNDLPKWLWLWLPLGIAALQYLVSGIGYAYYAKYLRGEIGFNEITSFLMLVCAAALGISIMIRLRGLHPPLFIWVLLGTLGCIFFAGEEASWGQHYFGWATPEEWAAANDQGETNIHNATGYGKYFDQVPRTLLSIGAVVGGVILPIWYHLRKSHPDPKGLWYWLCPTYVCMPIVIVAMLIGIPDSMLQDMHGGKGHRFDISSGEVKELCLAFFLMLYLASLRLRLGQVINQH